MSDPFDDVTAAFAGLPGVETGRMFNAPGLKFRGKAFALCVKGALVVKLDRPRALALVADGGAVPFDPGHGRAMKQWVAVAPARPGEWASLAREAYDYAVAQADRT
ncbi:MAG: TfoX/Sxy family protein [Alphaproteobacteria bacterium]